MQIKPEECYFCIDPDFCEENGHPAAWITPISYFEIEGAVYDQYLELEGIDWLIDCMEGLYEQTDIEDDGDLCACLNYDMETRLVEAGFKVSNAFSQFIRDCS